MLNFNFQSARGKKCCSFICEQAWLHILVSVDCFVMILIIFGKNILVACAFRFFVIYIYLENKQFGIMHDNSDHIVICIQTSYL